MRSATSGYTAVKLGVVLAFVGLCAVLGGYFYVRMGGRIPVIADVGGYRVSFLSNDIDNLLDDADVRIAGVEVGKVTARTAEGDRVRVELTLRPEFAPLHEGAAVRVGLKSLVGASEVQVVDGKGPAIPDGTTLPDQAVGTPVQLHDVIAGLDPKTRQALGGTLRSLGVITDGQAPNVDQLMQGLGRLGREGTTALDALAAQSEDIKALGGEGTRLLDALDTGQGRIAQVVDYSNRLTRATAGQRGALEATMRQLPGTLSSAQTATGELTELSTALGPVASDLHRAAPDLNQALERLPGITGDLRGLLPSLDGTLDEAPATLDRVPTLGTDVRAAVPELRTVLRDANPMLGYLKPYGRDLGAMLASFGASF
ncbi:MAG: MCE family protein, partial [Pseudonocardia sp.]|nr:MCE family protein [Pseudonocardia sp.]